MADLYRKIGCSAILAWCTVFLLTSNILHPVPLLMEPTSIFYLPATAGIAFLYLKSFFPFDIRRFLVSLLPGLLMGLMFVLGVRYSSEEISVPTAFSFFAALLSAALLFTAFISLFLLNMSVCYCNYRARSGEAGSGNGFRTYAVLLAITFAAYLPAFLAVYPGLYAYDASVQVLQFFGAEPITNHHPILHTLFFCGSLKLGEALFHSYQAGLALYSLLQIFIVAAAFSLVLYRMRRRNVPGWLILVSWLFLAANPYMQVFVLLTTKDVLFGAFFLLTFDFAIDLMSDPEHFFQSPGLLAGFYLSALLSCFFRNQGIYVFLFFAIFVLISFLCKRRKTRRSPALKWSAGAFLLTAVYLTVTGPVLTSLGVRKGDAREMLSVPMQQLARVWHEKPEQLTGEEREYIESLILPEALISYIPVNADPVKGGFQTEVVKEDPVKFLRIWAGIGAREPMVYLDSFLMGNWGYWYPGKTQYWINYISFDGNFMEKEYNILSIHRDSRFPRYEAYLRRISLTPEYEKVPVLSLVLNQAFPFWLMLLAATALFYRRRMRFLTPLTLLLGYWGTLLLGPVTTARYAFPLMICVPLLAELLLCDAFGGGSRPSN